jgi:hypothetical protein
MGTAFTPAKTSPASWDAFADVDAFVDEAGQSHMKNPVGGSMQRNPCYEQRNVPMRVPLRSGTLDPS